jgi:hypothetical protein
MRDLLVAIAFAIGAFGFMGAGEWWMGGFLSAATIGVVLEWWQNRRRL